MAKCCLNCGTEITDKFCPHCGQKAAVEKLCWHGLFEEVFHFFTHLQKGFFETALILIIHPGQLCKNYLDGKRKLYHKPVEFFLIWITIFLVLFNLTNHFTHFENEIGSSLPTNDIIEASVLSHYRSLIELLILPFTAFVVWAIIARPKLHYVEIVSISFYIVSFLFILLSIQLTLALLVGFNYKTDAFDITTTCIFSVWLLYAGYDIYRHYNVRYLLVRLILSMLVNITVYFYLSKMIIWSILKMQG